MLRMCFDYPWDGLETFSENFWKCLARTCEYQCWLSDQLLWFLYILWVSASIPPFQTGMVNVHTYEMSCSQSEWRFPIYSVTGIESL